MATRAAHARMGLSLPQGLAALERVLQYARLLDARVGLRNRPGLRLMLVVVILFGLAYLALILAQAYR